MTSRGLTSLLGRGLRNLVPLVFITLVAITGVKLLSLSHALSPFASADAHSGILSGSAITVTVPASSSGQAVQFGFSSTPPSTGIVTAGDSKTNCIYLSYANYTFQPALTAAEQATGLTYNCLLTFANADPAWSNWVSPWIDGAAYGYKSWMAADPSNRDIILSMNLIPDSESNNSDPLTWETPCDEGQFNTYATTLAQNLVATGFGHIVIRLGVEMNGTWENDFMGTTTAEQQAWAGCFQQEVTAMRAVSGANFLFDWNPNACVDNYPFANWYPGNAYVDIIGIDSYDAFCNGTHPTPSAATFALLAAEPDGLNAAEAFATQQGKPMSIPEWGNVNTPANGGTGLGDDPYYVQGIGKFVANNDVAFQSYFDPNDDSIIPLGSTYPLTIAAYIAAFDK